MNIGLDIGVFTWGRAQRLYDADPAVHWQRCEADGLQCPLEVFTQLFHAEANDPDFATPSLPSTADTDLTCRRPACLEIDGL